MRLEVKVFAVLTMLIIGVQVKCFALSQNDYVTNEKIEGGFCLAEADELASIYVDTGDYTGVQRAVGDLQADIERVTDRTAKIIHSRQDFNGPMVIIGSIGTSKLIDEMISTGKIDVSAIAGKWESFLIEVVKEPVAGVSNGLVIIGSDKRGTIYGIYDLSEQIGVSPWYWWADVAVKKCDSLFIKPERTVQGPPAVQYRGIFLNDEAPALTNWANEKYGGYNHQFYAKVFELILRLKGNYLWPAMWDNSFHEDDPENSRLANEYGIVMGTSHHEPMMRAHKDWRKNKKEYGNAEWDYATNETGLKRFWTEGVTRTRDYETIITLAMRGDGDEAMSEEANVSLLEKIVTDQRNIIAETINPDLTQVPQVWALYKEVQGYYERGMRVPDDVILMWCDDNWGNIRRLPTTEERARSGGAGVYYHFDYVGGPRSYRWINTNPLPKIWEQMNLAYCYDSNKIWIVNVGDLKPMELPIDFFLTFALDPERWPKEKLKDYTVQWAKQQFGAEYAHQIAEILSAYTKYNGRRKPEQLEPDLFSLTDYREAEKVVSDFQEIASKAEQLYEKMPPELKDAFFQLVLHPVLASSIINELYIKTGQNHLYAEQKRAATNALAQQVQSLFDSDAELAYRYHTMNKGKWNHMMDQTHIGYTSWDNPPQNIMPETKTIDIPAVANMAVAIEGEKAVWPDTKRESVLPEFSVFGQQKHYIEVFNKGSVPFDFSAEVSNSWILVHPRNGTVEQQTRLWVSIDWDHAPTGRCEGVIKVLSLGGDEVPVAVRIFNPIEPTFKSLDGFVEADGYVSIEPENYSRKVDVGNVRWETIEDYGRMRSGMSVFPVTASSVTPGTDSPCLEYKMYLFNTGQVEVQAILAPVLNFDPKRDVRIAVSFDDEGPQVLTIVPQDYEAGRWDNDWAESVSRNARTVKSKHEISGRGYHTLKIWMVDPGVVVQKIIVDTGGLKPCYLGPPESYFKISDSKKAECVSLEGAYVTGHYRNLFVEAGYDPEEVEKKVSEVFEQLFYGDPGTEAVYYPAGENDNGPLAYILDINNNDVRSEGMSYGMMVAVQLDKKAVFDSLWNWAKTYMYHDFSEHPAYGFFSWSMKSDGTPNDEMPAADGEEYFVTALYFAAHRWGNGDGIYDYDAQADRLLSDIKNRKVIAGDTVMGKRTAGSLFDLDTKMVRFTPHLKHCSHTDHSYHLPAFYELWALWGPPSDRDFWRQAIGISRDFFAETTHPETGLSPEYANFDGSPWRAPWRPESIEFQTDAWRTAMNWSFDWAWWAKDLRQCQLSDRLQSFFESSGLDDYVNSYTIDGRPTGKEQSPGLVAMNAVASLAATDSRRYKFITAFWETTIPTGRYRYYDGMLYMLAMLHCSGNYRIWAPEVS